MRFILFIDCAAGEDTIPVALVHNGQTYAIEADHLNTPRRLSNAQNQTIWQWGYSGFGEDEPHSTPEAPRNFHFNLRYPGQIFDAESGLFYNWHRSYDPSTGRYTQPDPIGLAGGWNRFVYAQGNPFTYYDPEGLWAWGDPIDPDIANAVTGFGDGSFAAITLGMGDLNELRQIVGIDGGINTSCLAYQWSKAGGQVVGTVALSGALHTSWTQGREISIGRNARIAPWGNRTGHPIGRYPHYHRRGGPLDPKGNASPGQGIGRHRPWEKRVTDKSWRDRF